MPTRISGFGCTLANNWFNKLYSIAISTSKTRHIIVVTSLYIVDIESLQSVTTKYLLRNTKFRGSTAHVLLQDSNRTTRLLEYHTSALIVSLKIFVNLPKSKHVLFARAVQHKIKLLTVHAVRVI